MAAPKKASNTLFSIKFHVVMSADMRHAVREDAKARNIPEGQVIRELIAEKYGLGKEHVQGYSHLNYQAIYDHNHVKRRDDIRPPSTKRMFHDVAHPLEAWKTLVIPKEDEENKDE